MYISVTQPLFWETGEVDTVDSETTNHGFGGKKNWNYFLRNCLVSKTLQQRMIIFRQVGLIRCGKVERMKDDRQIPEVSRQFIRQLTINVMTH